MYDNLTWIEDLLTLNGHFNSKHDFAMDVHKQGKALRRSLQCLRGQIQIERERPIACRLPIDNTGNTPHAVRKGYLMGRIAIHLHGLSCHSGGGEGSCAARATEGSMKGITVARSFKIIRLSLDQAMAVPKRQSHSWCFVAFAVEINLVRLW